MHDPRSVPRQVFDALKNTVAGFLGLFGVFGAPALFSERRWLAAICWAVVGLAMLIYGFQWWRKAVLPGLLLLAGFYSSVLFLTGGRSEPNVHFPSRPFFLLMTLAYFAGYALSAPYAAKHILRLRHKLGLFGYVFCLMASVEIDFDPRRVDAGVVPLLAGLVCLWIPLWLDKQTRKSPAADFNHSEA